MINDENKWVDFLIEQLNYMPNDDFEGYSLNEMDILFDFMKNPYSPVKINQLSDKAYEAIPLFNQVCMLMSILDEQDVITLTAAGNLPIKWVKMLYVLGHPESRIEISSKNVIKEQDTISVHLARVLLSCEHLCKVRNNKLSLTRNGKRIQHNKPALFDSMLNALVYNFNWGYFDFFDNIEIGRVGLGFTLILLAKYGNTQQTSEFYADKYFKAFPHLLINHNDHESFIYEKDLTKYSYCVRTFERYLLYFGLIEIITATGLFGHQKLIKKTPLFDQLITVFPPKSVNKSVLH